MDLQEFVENVPNLSDLELAVLLSLIAKQHCLVYAEDDLVDTLASELALIASDIFRLSFVVLESEDLESADRFGEAILDENHNFGAASDLDDSNDELAALRSRVQGTSFKASRSVLESNLDNRTVVNVVIAKDFNMASQDVQIQVLEMIRKKRIYSRTTVHVTPKMFLMLPIVSTSTKHIRLNHHLNDNIFMSHFHDSDDGFPNVENMDGDGDERPSLSFIKTASTQRSMMKIQVIEELYQLGQSAAMTVEIRRYLQDIVAFMRLERGVEGGLTPYGTVCFEQLAKYLAPLHGIDFVTPSLVGLAARKIYPHRITIAAPERERSMQYGSNIEAVKQYMDGLSPEDVIETVLAKVECPL